MEGGVFPFCFTRNVIGKAIGVLRALKLLKMSGSFHLFQMGRSPESRWKHPLHMRSLNLPHRTIVGENHYPNLPQETSRISVDAVAPVRHWRFLKEKKKKVEAAGPHSSGRLRRGPSGEGACGAEVKTSFLSPSLLFLLSPSLIFLHNLVYLSQLLSISLGSCLSLSALVDLSGLLKMSPKGPPWSSQWQPKAHSYVAGRAGEKKSFGFQKKLKIF